MIDRAEQSWLRFKRSKPGNRFQDRYRHRQRSGGGKLNKVINIIGGTVIALVSLVLGWAPGPGTATFFLGLAIVAGEIQPAARFLDWTEVKLRELAQVGRRIWTTSSPGEKALIVLAAVVCVVAIVLGLYRLLFGG